MKGVSKVDMNYKKGQFTLHVTEGTTVTPTAIRKAVRKKFEIPLVEIVSMTGKVMKSAAGVHLLPAGQKKTVVLRDLKNKKVVVMIPDGAIVQVAGKLTEKTVGKTTQLAIEVATAKKVTPVKKAKT